MALAKVMVVELDEGLNRLLHRAHLDQGHLAVLPTRQRQSEIGSLRSMRKTTWRLTRTEAS